MTTNVPEKDLPIHSFETPDKWREWLQQNHTQHEGIWLLFFKKNSGIPSVNYAEALDEALCFGWIDSQLKKCDDKSWYQKFTPRRPKSVWSIKNTENVERLTKSGKMQPAGMKEVEAAKKDGRWEAAYESQRRGKPPEDFMLALSENEIAQQFFQTLDKHNTYAIYYRLQNAKTPESRENRIKLIIAMLEKGQKLHNK